MPSFHHYLLQFIRKKENRQRIDGVMGVAAVAHPMIAIPQVLQIYITKQATGLSLLTWGTFGLFGFIFLAYGFVHKLRPYIIMQLIWITVNTSIVVGILLYG